MTSMHVDAQGQSWRPFMRFTCPNHPDGPPTLPADGYDREELRVDEAFDADEIADLKHVVGAAKALGHGGAAGRVERMLGLCCISHHWKVAGFRQLSKSDVTISNMADLLVSMQTPLLTRSILLDELTGNLPAGRELRIPLILEGTKLPRSAAAEAALAHGSYSLDPAKPPTVE